MDLRFVITAVLLAALPACTRGAAPQETTITTVSDGATTTIGEGGELSAATLVPPIRLLGATAAYEEALFEANNLMIEAWQELGLEVETTLLADVTEVIDAGANREYEAISFGYGGRIDRIDPNELLSRPFLCDLAGPGGSNYSDYCYEPYDEVVLGQKRAVDPEERQSLVWRAQEIQALDIPWVTVYHPSEIYAYNNQAYGNVVPAFTVGLFNFHNFVQAEPLIEDRVLRVGSDDVFRSINPMAAESYQSDVEVQRLVFDTLAKIQPDGTVGEHLAESWEFVDDSTLIVTLRAAQFTDGQPVTAEDVKFSYDYFKEWDVGLYIDPLAEIDSVDVIDDQTVQFNLTGPSATVLFNALSAIMILPQHIWGEVVETEGLQHPSEWTETNLIGSGPFMVQTVAPGEAIELVRNDNFWGTVPPSERLSLLQFGDSAGVFRALQEGSVYFHWTGSLAPDGLQQIESGAVPNLTAGEVGSTTTRGVGFRMSEGSPFRDYHFRLALAHTYDKEFAVQVGNRGFAQPGAGTIAPDNEFWYNPNIPQEELEEGVAHWHQFDLEHARQILADAGYRWDDEGRLHYPSADYVPQKVHFDD
jgi:peptide/nickel transport system substrate-binding protein